MNSIFNSLLELLLYLYASMVCRMLRCELVAAQRGKHRHELFMSLDTSKLPLGRSKSYLCRYQLLQLGYLPLQFRLPPPANLLIAYYFSLWPITLVSP